MKLATLTHLSAKSLIGNVQLGPIISPCVPTCPDKRSAKISLKCRGNTCYRHGMIDPGKQSANSGATIKPIARQAGATQGQPRPVGAGRKKGVPNRITRDVREAAQKHGAKALRRLVQLMADPDARVAISAVREVLDRAYGKPVSPQEISGKDGVPFYPEGDMDGRRLAQNIAFALAKGARETGCDMPSQSTQGAASTPPAPSCTPAQTEPNAPAAPAESDPAAAPTRDETGRLLAQARAEHAALQEELHRPEQRGDHNDSPKVVRMFGRDRRP